MKKLFIGGLAVLVVLAVVGFAIHLATRPQAVPPPPPAQIHTDLAAHSAQFEREVVRVMDGVWMAIGFGIANSIMIEGDDGLIIVDSMTTNQEAQEVLAEFRKISDKQVKAIVYTHSHPDHVFGAGVFAQGGKPRVFAHESTAALVRRLATEMRPAIASRSMRMYGNYLPPEYVENVGIGPFVGMDPEISVSFLDPTDTFTDTLTASVAGVDFQLIHVGGETNDQIFMWIPEKSLLLPGDNFYWTFPNLYTIRGTVFRSLKNWYTAIDRMLELDPEHLAPSHTQPLHGKEKIRGILENYRDAIQYVHDQSIRGMNMGLNPDELAEHVKLPPHLAGAPYLQPFYGKASWSARSMFAGNLGWFDGDSATLQPLTRKNRAKLMAEIAGGEENLLAAAQKQAGASQWQAALELTGHLLRLDINNAQAKQIRVLALTRLAEEEQNPNARHYYLSEAYEIQNNTVITDMVKPTDEVLSVIPLKSFFASLAVNLDPEAAAEINQKAAVVFPQDDQAFEIHVRWGVARIKAIDPKEVSQQDHSIVVVADTMQWKRMLGQVANPATTLAGFEYPKGGAVSFGRFLKLFEPPQPKRPFEAMKAD